MLPPGKVRNSTVEGRNETQEAFGWFQDVIEREKGCDAIQI
jgi:hypothetical protein